MSDLAALLGYQSNYFYKRWPESELPAMERVDGVLCATYDAIDAWFAAPGKRYFGFEAPVTAEQLVSGRLILVPPGVVKEKLCGEKEYDADQYAKYFQALLARGDVAGVQLRSAVWLLELESVEAFAILKNEILSTEQVAKVLGLTRPAVRLLVETGHLEKHHNRGVRNILRVVKSRLYAYIDTFCTIFGEPPKSPDEWVAEQLASPLSLMPVREVMAELELTRRQVYRLLGTGELCGIQAAGKIHITPESVKRYYLDNWLTNL